MWDGKEQKFRRPDSTMKAHDAHDMDDEAMYMIHDDDQDHYHEQGMQEEAQEDTLDAFLARSVKVSQAFKC